MDPKSQHVEPATPDMDKAKKKSGGPVQIFKVALFMLRRRSTKPKSGIDMGSTNKSMWRRLLGSMRPLHIQGNESPQTVVEVDMSLAPSKPKEYFEEPSMPLSSPSPSSMSSASSSSSFGTSEYASATNLKELDDSSEGDDGNAIEDDKGGDEMIDAKAEEFIAQFYEQMRRQRQDY